MSIVMQINPFDFFTDTNGDALDAGYVWIGQPNLDPRQYPIVAYYDAALTIPAAMPLRTSNGYIARSGTPTFLYVSGNYSVLVQNKKQQQVYYVPDFLMIGNQSAVTVSDLANTTDFTKGVAMVGRGVVAVASIADLLLQPQRADLIYDVRSYDAGGSTGGNQWRWNPASTAPDDYGSVLAVVGVVTGRFEVIKNSRTWSAYEYGVSGTRSATDNRLRLVALYKHLNGSANTVHLIDEDYNVDASAPIIVPADTTTIGGKGTLTPVFSTALPPASSAANPDGTFKCYGGVFATGDPISGNRYSETNFIYLGRVTWTGVKIKNTTGITTTTLNFLHGILAHGGINVYTECQIDDMPNNGIATSLFAEAHYIRTKCRRNGLTGGGFARNGISNTATQSLPLIVFPANDRSRFLTVVNGIYTENLEEGIQYANCPFVWIEGNDCKFNQDLSIEGDSAYAQASKTRENDQIHIYGNDLRGVNGLSKGGIGMLDGFNKDVFMSGNHLGGYIGVSLSVNCALEGSLHFTGRNEFELTNTALLNGCHAIYANAGLIDLSAGFTVTGSHDRSAFNSVLISANNDLAAGVLIVGNVKSNVKFSNAIVAKTNFEVRVRDVLCSTSRSFANVTLTADTPTVEFSRCDGPINSDAATDQGFLFLNGLNTFTLAKLMLENNFNDVNAATRYPVAVPVTAVAGKITRLFSTGNYWQDYAYTFGVRLTSLAGLAVKTSALDLPVLA